MTTPNSAAQAAQEAERNAAAESYFDARPSLDTVEGRRIYEAGFDRAYALLSKLRAPVADRQKLLDLVDVVWNEATESTAVPDTPWADRLIEKVFPTLPAIAPVADERAAFARAITGRDDLEPHQVENVIDANLTRWTTWRAARDYYQQARAALASAPVAGERSCTQKSFINELGNRITITIEGPTSTSENILTPIEVAQLHEALKAHTNASVAREALKDGAIIGRITVKGKGRSSVDLDASHADLPAGEYLIRAVSENSPSPRIGWTNDQMISFASMVLFKGVASDSVEQLLTKFRELEAIRGNAAPQARTVAGEAQPAMRVFVKDGKASHPTTLGDTLPDGFHDFYAAPQASAEPARNAALEEAAKEMDRLHAENRRWHNEFREAAAVVRALKQSQADKDGGAHG